MEEPDNASVITDSEIIEALVAISIVAKSLAKKVMVQSIKNEKVGGEKNEQKGCSCQNSKLCK